MPDRIAGDNAHLFKDFRVAQDRLRHTMNQLSTGKQLTRPGDDSVAYDKITAIGIDRSSSQAQLETLQTRVSWYQTSVEYLSNIRELLTSMTETTIRAASGVSGAADIEVLDASFQGYKQEISRIIDGVSGTAGSPAGFNEVPLFFGFLPDTQIGGDVPSGKIGQIQPSLYTGYGRDGFDTLPLLTQGATTATVSHTATATTGTATTITLGDGAAAIDDVYVGTTLTITAGTGIGQTATISDYNAVTRVATLSTALGTPPDATSVYRIDALESNEALKAVGGLTQLRVASWLWGADNSRGKDEKTTFQPLTAAEQTYRTANAIPDTDLEAKTYAERLERRKNNIFDGEYGNLQTENNVERMQERLKHALNTITELMTEHDSRAESIQSQRVMQLKQQEAQDFSIDTFEKVDAFKTSSLMQTLSIDPARIIELAARLTENIGKLNDLVRSGGTR